LEQHTDFTPAPLARNDVSLGFHGNAVLVRRGLGVTGMRRFALPGFEPRGAVMVTLEDQLDVVGVHLGLMRQSRRAQLARIRRKLAALPRATVIAGDFNEWSPEHGLEALGNGFTVHAPGRSYHAARPIAALDRIALSPRVRLLDAGVEEGAGARMASDHLPVWGDLLVSDG
jgi:endonuclease/exonuclease/phosphatase family metal-dependent hydrolase